MLNQWRHLPKQTWKIWRNLPRLISTLPLEIYQNKIFHNTLWIANSKQGTLLSFLAFSKKLCFTSDFVDFLIYSCLVTLQYLINQQSLNLIFELYFVIKFFLFFSISSLQENIDNNQKKMQTIKESFILVKRNLLLKGVIS